MTYLIWVAAFGTAVTLFLWLRDARIFFRTGYPDYRKAAYYGVLCGALATLGLMVAWTMDAFEILGLGLILAALYIQGKIVREKVWEDEGTPERLLGSVRMHQANKR